MATTTIHITGRTNNKQKQTINNNTNNNNKHNSKHNTKKQRNINQSNLDTCIKKNNCNNESKKKQP